MTARERAKWTHIQHNTTIAGQQAGTIQLYIRKIIPCPMVAKKQAGTIQYSYSKTETETEIISLLANDSAHNILLL
jgi:hypothetical protein